MVYRGKMKAYLLMFAPVFLLPCWMLSAGCWQTIPLNMVPDAVDDMYSGCTKEMEERVNKEYFKKELVGKFKTAWQNAAQCANRPKAIGDEALTKNHLKAICAYTSDDVYEDFNYAVRTGGSTYGSSFKYHSLHFWLTSAIQILKRNQQCHTTYRRVSRAFEGKVNDIIRFGVFASSSYDTDLSWFGRQTCYQITTCYGAYLRRYSSLGTAEREVLIPPYEKFKITHKYTSPHQFSGLTDCRVVFVLKSVEYQSNLNCKAAKNSNASSRPLRSSGTGLLVVPWVRTETDREAAFSVHGPACHRS
ncbi:Ecto-ADP-ribosyltransferase 5 [Merluccius polli]|uniref:NAD(P)(+)--arginine ADP-ribosyltransferase n=1 Tax=Merluccius polli TaxID=89951 RepID=A0AA47MX64_MERPO|nr:Ecto-ADP-ribosyltransferase 5 [Merluccius polli]